MNVHTKAHEKCYLILLTLIICMIHQNFIYGKAK